MPPNMVMPNQAGMPNQATIPNQVLTPNQATMPNQAQILTSQNTTNNGGVINTLMQLNDKIIPRYARPSVDLMTIDAQINGVSVEVLLDSGANRTIISNELAEQLNLPIEPLSEPMSAEGIGGSVNFIGKVKIDLRIGNASVKLIVAVAKHHEVFNKTSFLAIISYSTLRYFPMIQLDAANDRMIIAGKTIKIGQPHSKGNAYAARVIDTKILPPNMVTKVSVCLDGMAPCDGFHVRGDPKTENKNGFEVIPALLPADAKTSSYVYVTNPGSKPISLHSGMNIAQAIPIQDLGDGNVREIRSHAHVLTTRVGYLDSSF
jgi:predicted aspartyl protease